MRIAVVGTGITGNVAAYKLAKEHDITVFEADNRIGGHTNTVDVEVQGKHHAVDTGFIVYNPVTYPNFIALLDELGVASQDSEMSFSVQDEVSGLEYNGANLNTLFAQRRNLLRPSFYRMIKDILRFNREAPALLDSERSISLGEYLKENQYCQPFLEHYIIPMGAAIWSADPGLTGAMPARFFIRFFVNHCLLSVNGRPTWRVIKGGSNRYLDKLVAGHWRHIHLNSPVEWIKRFDDHVEIKVPANEPQRFDQVFLACHSDQALKLLADPSPQEQAVLEAIHYQENHAVLHTDARLMPNHRLAWAAWNYHITRNTGRLAALTYNMNILQTLNAPVNFCVTLNHADAIDEAKVIDEFTYAHPVFTKQAVAAQLRQAEINGPRRTYYCGAYWRYGFHEDGVISALNAIEHFQQRIIYEEQNLSRPGAAPAAIAQTA